MKKIVIASHNEGKLREITALIAPLGIEAISAAALHVPEPEETGSTFAENAALKATHCAAITKLPSLSDDSGLVVPAIGGNPGIYSARWAGAGKDFSIAFKRIQDELGSQNPAAYFICNLCLALNEDKVVHFEGRIDGVLQFPPRGEKGFGYDPIFVPNGFSQSFAEISPDIKNTISHRSLAFSQFVEYLTTHVS